MSFWKQLTKPLYALAPMYEVTDTAFRRVLARYGKPDVMFTEFASVDGIANNEGRMKITDYLLRYNDSERPLAAQLWGNDPKKFYDAARYIKSLGFDGVDINMGCPDKQVIKAGAGAALIDDPKRAREIIAAAKEGAGDIPVSVKTRLGMDTVVIERWMEDLLAAKPAAIIVHGRTKKEMSKVPAHWDAISKAAEIAKGSGVLILGNGDVESLKDAGEKAKKYGLDGIMIGRAALGNPWFFNKEESNKNHTVAEKLRALAYHAELFEEMFPGVKRFEHIRKHIKGYISGFDGARELRMKLMDAQTADELKELIASRAA